jgi:hypothetical protein
MLAAKEIIALATGALPQPTPTTPLLPHERGGDGRESD